MATGATQANASPIATSVAGESPDTVHANTVQAATNGPQAGTRKTPFFSRNYLSVISLYSLLLLSECCFWNIFGFDRSAAQFYFLAPISFRRVLFAKNLTSMFFVTAEISAITLVCAALGLPMGVERLSESIAVAAVVSLFLLSAGNLQSIHNARAVNPANSFRSSAAGRAQIMLFLVYPVIFSPVALAYWARGRFGSEAAFFAVLAIEGILAGAAYALVLKSAAASAESTKEEMLVALSAADGPIAA
jgi:ABC-2 type transport system permease protein